MERKVGSSSSRSPSLSRRPSLKDKQGGGKVNRKKGPKRERWLLTRKTWRYMTDAVGNLLPEYKFSASRRGSIFGGHSSPPGEPSGSSGAGGVSARRSSAHANVGITDSHHHEASQSSQPSSPTWGQGQQAELQQKIQQQQQHQQHHQQFQPHPGQQVPKPSSSKPTSPTSSSFPTWATFGSHRPGVTPTGPGPGQSQQGHTGHQKTVAHTSTVPPGKFVNPNIDPDDISQVEQHFQDVCYKQKRFLLWTRTKPKAPSGPALKEMKEKLSEEKQKQKQHQHQHDYFSETENEDEDGFANEYDFDDDEQITVRERRKSSTASSVVSIIGAPGRNIFPTVGGGLCHSDTSYTLIGLEGGEHKVVRNTGTQTGPFPEEWMIRLRLQVMHEERQRQIAQLIRQHQHHGESGENAGTPTSGENPQWYGGGQMSIDPTTGLTVMTGSGSSAPGRRTDPKNPSVGGTDSSGLPCKETVIPINQERAESGHGGSESGRESEEKILDKGGSARGSEADKKSEESGYSSSISDTVMKYLRIMRKNSKADNKETIDRFKTVNYDRSLRYIKSKNVTLEEALEHEKNKALGVTNKPSDVAPVTLPELEGKPKTPRSQTAKKPQSQTSQQLQPQQSSISPQTQKTFSTNTNVTSVPNSPTSSPNSPPLPASIEQDRTSMEISSPSSSMASPPIKEEKKQTKVKKGKKAKAQPQQAGTGSAVVAAGQMVDTKEISVETGHQAQLSSSSSQPPSTSSLTKEAIHHHQQQQQQQVGTQGMYGQVQQPSTSSASCSPPGPLSPQLSSSSPPPAVIRQVTSPPKEIGIQAGESLIRLLRKFSQFSSASASESPAEFGSLSPRLSIATTMTEPMTDSWFMAQQHMYQHQHSTTSSGIPTTTRSSFDLYSVGGGDTQSDWEDTWMQQLLQYQQLFHEHQQQGHPVHSDAYPSMATTTTTSTSTTVGPHHQNQPISHSQSHQGMMAGDRACLNVKISSSPMPSSTSTPSTPGGSSIISSHSTGGGVGGSAAGLMKSFFSSSPFGGFRSSSSKKVASTTSLVTPGVNAITSSPRGLLGFGLGHPPTTSSSPNLTSLAYPSSSSSSRSHGQGHTSSGFSRSPTTDFILGLGRSGFGSKVSQRGQMSLPLTDPSSASSVMQKSKSSSSVTATAGSGGAGSSGRLISKSSRIFSSKSRSKSSTRAATSSSGSGTCSWAPEGKCKWRAPNGKSITLEPTTTTSLSEIERQTLQEVALEKLKAIPLGVEVTPLKEKSGPQTKPKRRPYLLKKKALSTGFFEGGKREDGKQENTGGGSGNVFGISVSQCVANDKIRQQQKERQGQSAGDGNVPVSTKNGNKGSVPPEIHQDKGSTESLFWKKRGSVAAVPDVPSNNPLSQMQLLQPPQQPAVPQLVTACIQHLENYGLHTTGIFRVSTSLRRMRQLREEIDGGKEIEFGEEHSPHDVAALLKEFLRDLPEPLLSRDLYQAFLRTQKIRNRKQQLEAVQHLVQLLPPANRDTLHSLLSLFAKVVANAGETRGPSGEILPGNKMEGYSLATLIAPNILPCIEATAAGTTGDQIQTKERRESIDVVNYMISNYEQLFHVPAELLHDVYLHLMDTQPEYVEGLLKLKSGFVDDPMDEAETNSVFGDEGGDVPDTDEPAPAGAGRIFRRREDILHEGAGAGFQEFGGFGGRTRGNERSRGGRESSREEGQQSGGESDSSSTKSTSRWFRRPRITESTKSRTASDSGSEKAKSSTKSSSRAGLECKRANSLDSVNVKEPPGATPAMPREKSNSDQSLKVPENLNRRQSSPVLESAGVITASLKIPIPAPLNIDDTDIPFIEEDQQPELQSRHPSQSSYGYSRNRAASTDSSALMKSPSSSYTTTPISSPIRQPSSGVSSPQGLSLPGSPPYDPRTFPYEEMTARMLIGGSAPSESSTTTTSSVPTIISSTSPSKFVTSSFYLQPAASSTNMHSEPQSETQTATASVYIPGIITEPKSLGKETKGAAIGGLIKSKTADFEKLAKSSSSVMPTVSTTTYSIAPKMRLRSQENIVLKQQFLLRQQQLHHQTPHSPYAHPSQEEGRRQAEAKRKQSSVKETSSSPSKSSSSATVPHPESQRGSTGSDPPVTTTAVTEPGQAPKPLQRRRPVRGSMSSSAIIPTPAVSTSEQRHQPHPSTRTSSSVVVQTPTVSAASSTTGHTQSSSTPVPASASPSRWKRSEIIASRQNEEKGGRGGGPPETFL